MSAPTSWFAQVLLSSNATLSTLLTKARQEVGVQKHLKLGLVANLFPLLQLPNAIPRRSGLKLVGTPSVIVQLEQVSHGNPTPILPIPLLIR